MASNAEPSSGGDQQKNDEPMKQTILIIEHKIRNLEKRKLKLEGYLQRQRDGIQLTDDQLIAASKFNEVVSTLEFARNLKNQLRSLVPKTKPKKQIMNVETPTKIDSNKIKEVLIFQNILESIKDETVKQDLLNGDFGDLQLTNEELSKLSSFSKMVSPKRGVKEGKPLFEDQLKTISKHYMKLLDSKPNFVVGTSYAHLKECLLKIEKSGCLDYIIKHVDVEVDNTNEINSLDTITNTSLNTFQPIVPISDNIYNDVPVSSLHNLEFTANKIDTIYFTNNSISDIVVEQKPIQNNIAEPVFNNSFEFLQDSQLEEDHVNVDLNSIPTQTFSSSLYINNGPTDDAILKILSSPPEPRTMESSPYEESKINHLETITNVSNSNSWPEKSEVNWQSKTETTEDNNLPKDNWSMAQMLSNSSNNDWLIKNNWVHMVEADKQSQNQSPQKNDSPNFDLATNGYTENLDELLQTSVIFNKQESYPTNTSNNSTFYQNSYRHHSPDHNIDHYTNSQNGYDRGQSNKRYASLKSKSSYAGEGGSSRGYNQGNSYVYNNRSYKNNSNHYNNTANDYSRISRQT